MRSARLDGRCIGGLGVVLVALFLSAGCHRRQPSGAQPGQKLGRAAALPALTRAAPDSIFADAELRAATTPERPASPLSLTASDGTGLRLVRLQARAVVQGPLAFTELHLTFENPQPRQLEGRFSITLPPAASISRFAMRLPTGWQEAEVVERQAARRAYEDFLHRRQDPALLEHEAGNQFSARVFPIPAQARKELIIAYSEELASPQQPYRLPLLGLPRLDELAVTAIVGDQTTDIVKRDVVPTHDLLVKNPATQAGRSAGVRSENLMVARLRIQGEQSAAQRGTQADDSLVVLIDTSASRALGFADQLRLVADVVQGLAQQHAGALPLTVAAFDQTVVPMYQGPASGFDGSTLSRITQRGPLGASDLSKALAWAAATKQQGGRLLLVTDGVNTAGSREEQPLTAQAALLTNAGYRRIDVLLCGGIRDGEAMRPLTHGVVAEDGTVIDGSQGAAAALQKLQRATYSGVAVAVAGARWTWPRQLDGVQPGDDVLVYAELSQQQANVQQATITLGGALRQQQTVALTDVARPLLERAYVRARIAGLNEEIAALDAGKERDKDGHKAAVVALRRSIVSLSTRFRVLSDQTALLVLETEEDYKRFGIDRRALADVLFVGDRGVEVMAREPLPDETSRLSPLPSQQKSPTPPPQDHAAQWAKRMRHTGIAAVLSAPPPDPASIDALPKIADPTAPDGKEEPSSESDEGGEADEKSVGDAFGAGGLGLIGSGGSGGTGEGVDSIAGLGSLGTIGRGGGGQRLGAPSVGIGLSRTRTAAPPVLAGQPEVNGSLDRDIIRRVIRQHINEIRFCYERELSRNPRLAGRVNVRFVITPAGNVAQSQLQMSTLANPTVETCITRAMMRWQFPRPQGGIVTVTYPFVFATDGQPSPPDRDPQARSNSDWRGNTRPAYSGKFGEVMAHLAQGQRDAALSVATGWHSAEPGDILALVALGEVFEAQDDLAQAARAYGSILDLFPSRADLRRFAGQRLDRLAANTRPGAVPREAAELAADTYRRAVQQRPDHPASHRLRAYALLRLGDPAAAFAAIETGLQQRYPSDRFRGVQQILAEDMSLLGAAWAHAEPQRLPEIQKRLAAQGQTISQAPSLRFVLYWETDANDVDFHIEDGQGGHAYFSDPELHSGGRLYADVTTGYGPECFNIPGQPRAFPYRLGAHYYSRGPMGYGMGKMQIVQHDGRGGLKFSERPFVVMNDQAYVDLGTIKAPL